MQKDGGTAPTPHKGVQMDTLTTKKFSSKEEAERLFLNAEKRMLDINRWNDINGAKENQYQLTDPRGNPKSGFAQEQDYIRFKLPLAPSSDVGKGEDWVRIEKIVSKIHKDKRSVAMIVRPAANPTTVFTTPAHFYSTDTTNTFMVQWQGKEVTAGVFGRNEEPNIEEPNSLYNKLRNFLMGTLAWLGIAKTQWATLIKGWLKE